METPEEQKFIPDQKKEEKFSKTYSLLHVLEEMLRGRCKDETKSDLFTWDVVFDRLAKREDLSSIDEFKEALKNEVTKIKWGEKERPDEIMSLFENIACLIQAWQKKEK